MCKVYKKKTNKNSRGFFTLRVRNTAGGHLNKNMNARENKNVSRSPGISLKCPLFEANFLTWHSNRRKTDSLFLRKCQGFHKWA